MTKYERGVKEVIAQNSRFAVEEINVTDALDKFISSFMADRLARELKRKFIKIDTTSMTNQLFSTIKKVSELITNVQSYYIDAA